MSKLIKLLAFVLPTLVAVSASADSVSNPDGAGGCFSADYSSEDWGAQSSTYFTVPAMQHGESVWVMGGQTNRYGQTSLVQTEFSCSDGVITSATTYDNIVSWYLYDY